MLKRKYIIIGLLAFCLTATLFIGITTSENSSSLPYDPWYDLNDDGRISITDIVLLALRFGTTGTPINKTALLLNLQARVASLNASLVTLQATVASLNTSLVALQAKLNAEVGKIHIPYGNGTICSTRNGGYVLKWDYTHFDILLDNNSGDWLDYWYFNKGSYDQGAIWTGTTNHLLIDWTGINDDGAEIHFGQADGTGGWCSVWVQYANGWLVGHYIKY